MLRPILKSQQLEQQVFNPVVVVPDRQTPFELALMKNDDDLIKSFFSHQHMKK